MHKTRKNVVRGWNKRSPNYHQRTVMLQKCGKRCFLGTHKSFPICSKNTCKINTKGVYAAYIRSRQYSSKGKKYKKIAVKSKNILIKMGVKH